jgi:hypothetical protein
MRHATHNMQRRHAPTLLPRIDGSADLCSILAYNSPMTCAQTEPCGQHAACSMQRASCSAHQRALCSVHHATPPVVCQVLRVTWHVARHVLRCVPSVTRYRASGLREEAPHSNLRGTAQWGTLTTLGTGSATTHDARKAACEAWTVSGRLVEGCLRRPTVLWTLAALK